MKTRKQKYTETGTLEPAGIFDSQSAYNESIGFRGEQVENIY